jgi:hypothetical protein
MKNADSTQQLQPAAMSSSDELWGTFAVDDHLRRRAFVAEIVLFDRLVIPEPPESDKSQYERWTKAGWQPHQLKETVDRLGDLAIPVPWDQPLRDKWQAEYQVLADAERAALRMSMAADALADFHDIKRADPSQPSMWVTRRVIAKKLEGGFGALDPVADEALYRKIKAIDVDPAANIETVVGYGSYATFSKEIPIDVTHPATSTEENTALLFGWDFLVPEDSALDDATLLDRAIKLSRQSEFRDSRRRFHDWRRRLIVKRVSVETARSEMNRCLSTYNQIVAKNYARARTLTALQVLALATPLADLALPGVGMVGGVVFGMGAFLAEKLLPHREIGAREKVAALVHDSREAFGWHDRKSA